MPKRHNNHQIEDASRRQFEMLLPDAWVSRPKSSDYGTDLEIEIFEDDGTATCLMFYVQLRGTDDPKKETTTRLSLEQLHYFQKLDVPTLLVRFCRKTGKFHCKWHQEIHTTPKQEQQKSIVVHFSNDQRWTENTLDSIGADLKIARYAANMPPSGRISISFDAEGFGPSKRFEFKAGSLKAAAIYGAILSPDAERTDKHLPIQVTQLDVSIVVSCGKLTKVEVPISDLAEDLPAALLYAICILCSDLGCAHQALEAARSVLQHRLSASNTLVAFRAACALQTSPVEMVDFALLNGLEDPSIIENSFVTVMLVSASQNSTSRDWLQRWFDSVEKFALQNDMRGPVAATNYNRGNAALQTADFASAVRYYNKARKLRPEYLAADYFLQEFGGALYNSRHYGPASRLYAMAIGENSSATEWNRLGDAQLLSGNIASAIASFDKATQSRKPCPEMYSSLTKLSLCHWLLEKYKEPLPARYHEASVMLQNIESRHAQNEEEYRRILEEANALDPVSNFNVGISCSKREEYNDALQHFLLCGIQCPNDYEAWINAMISSWGIDYEEFFTVLSAAYAHNALEGYAYFRNHVAEQGMPENLIEMLDALVGEISDPTSVSEEFTKWVQKLTDRTSAQPSNI